jgi:hypothetical protein
VVRAWSQFDDDRRRMVEETSRFITWGLKHPDKVRWIPTRPESEGGFSRRMALVYWTPVLADLVRTPGSWLKRLFRR